MKKSELIFNVVLVPVDFAMLISAGITTYFLRTQILSVFRPVLFEFNLPLEKYFLLVLAVSAVFIITYAISGLYSLRSTRSVIEEFFKVAIASSAGIMAVIIYIFLSRELFDSRFLVIGAWILSIVFVSVGRFLVKQVQKSLVAKRDYGVNKVMIIGEDDISNKIAQAMSTNPEFGYRLVKQLANPEVAEVKSAIGNPGIDEVILANPNYPQDKVLEIVDFCHENHLIFRFVPNIYQTLTTNATVDTFAGIPIVELKRTALGGWGSVIKRLVDVSGSVFGLIVLLPSFLIIAFMIKWETEGPIFVKLDRMSKNKKFKLLKFRSMINNAAKYKHLLTGLNDRSDGPLFKIRNDPRITKIGKFIRKTRIDELPQFWNVLRGDISLVGPRPHEPGEIEKYQKHHRNVLAIKAGATGLAQVSGSSDLSFEKEVAIDILYIESWSLFGDIKIIIKTFLKMFRDKSAA